MSEGPLPGPQFPNTHLFGELGGPQKLQGLQMGVEKGAGLQADPQLALNDVPYGAVIRQADEG